MAGWFFQRGGGAAQGRLKQLLKAYPPYRIPHRGPGMNLGRPQAEANLAYLVEHRSERLAAVRQLLAEFGLDLDAGLSAADPKPFLDQLWRWTTAEWPAVYDPAFRTIDAWLHSTREGPEIVFSMIMDTGIALAELILVRRPDYAWALDLDSDNLADDMVSWQRPVLVRPAQGGVSALLYDGEESARQAYVNCTDAILNDMTEGVLNVISGAHEQSVD